MTKNNFKELEEKELEQVTFDEVGVHNNIGSTMGIVRFVTDIVELYIPNILETVLSTLNHNHRIKK